MSGIEVLNIGAGAVGLLQVAAAVSQLSQTQFGVYAQLVHELKSLESVLRNIHSALDEPAVEQSLQNNNTAQEVFRSCQATVESLQHIAEEFAQKSRDTWKIDRYRKQSHISRLRRELKRVTRDLEDIALAWPPRGKHHFPTTSYYSSGMLLDITKPSDPWRGKLVLCLDGGGIRGYASLMVLDALVKAIAKREQELDHTTFDSYSSPLFQVADDESVEFRSTAVDADDSDRRTWDAFRLCHYFDYICGTSTGGIVAIMLSTMRCTMGEAVDYNRDICRGLVPRFKRLSRSFPLAHSKTRNSLKMQTSLKNVFRDSDAPSDDETRQDHVSRAFLYSQPPAMTMKTKDGRCQTIVFVSHNTGKGHMQPYAIRSYELTELERKQRRVLNAGVDTTQIPLVDVCRATSAAPTYFKKVQLNSVDGSFRDGGICTNNSAEKVFNEVSNRHSDYQTPVRGLLSIGGVKRRKETSQARKLDDLQSLMSYQTDESESYIRKQQSKQGFKYNRIVCDTASERSGDPEKMLGKIEKEAKEFCDREDVKQMIKDWAWFLVDIRRERSETVGWATYAGLSVTPGVDPVESTQGRREIWQQLGESGAVISQISERDSSE